MKTIAITSAVALAALAGTVHAGIWGSNPDTVGGILHALEQPGYVGTSMRDDRARLNIRSVNAAFPNGDVDESGYAVGRAGTESGQGDLYGHVVFSSRR